MMIGSRRTTAIEQRHQVLVTQLAQIIEDQHGDAFMVVEALHDAVLQRSRLIREHAMFPDGKKRANAMAYLSHLIGEAARQARVLP